MSVYNLKDIIRINQEIGEKGELRNQASLDFALSMMKGYKSWLYELSHFVRCLAVDHPFVDGNKRTAFMLCTLYFDDNKRQFDDEKLVKAIFKIAKKSINNVNAIGRELLKC